MSRVWTSQPQVPVGIDWRNPITRGLVQGSYGPYSIDIQGIYKSSYRTTTRRVTSYGIGEKLNGASGYIRQPTVADSSHWSMVVYAVVHSAGVHALMTCAEEPGNGTYDRSIFLSTTYGVNGYLFDGAAKSANSSLNVSVGEVFLGSVVANGSSLTVYKNAVPGTPIATSNTGYTGYSTPELVIGYGGGSANGGSNTLASAATIAYALRWNRALSAAEIKSLSDNPWQIFQPLPSRIFVGPAAAVTNPSGDLAATETDGDTSAFTGIVLVQGAAAATDSGTDTFAATGGAATSTGTLAATETGSDTATSTGTVLVKGTLAATDSGSDTATSTGTVLVQGTAAATDSGTDTFAATGGSIITATGTLDATESGSDSAASSGTILVQGLLAAFEAGGDTVYIEGQIYVIGALAATEVGDDVFSATSQAPLFTQEQLDYLLAYMEATMAFPTPTEIATAVLLAAQTAPIASNIEQVHTVPVAGSGTAGDPWGPA